MYSSCNALDLCIKSLHLILRQALYFRVKLHLFSQTYYHSKAVSLRLSISKYLA